MSREEKKRNDWMGTNSFATEQIITTTTLTLRK
jgi:hypothetical protein